MANTLSNSFRACEVCACSVKQFSALARIVKPRATHYQFIILIILDPLNCFFNSSMSSIYATEIGPEKAYDGNINTQIHSVPDNTALHWWRGDFNARIRIKSIRLVARQDCCQNRLDSYEIFAVLSDAKTGTSTKILFATTQDITMVNEEKRLNCNQIADGLILESPISKNGGLLNFGEIYIYGEEVKHN